MKLVEIFYEEIISILPMIKDIIDDQVSAHRKTQMICYVFSKVHTSGIDIPNMIDEEKELFQKEIIEHFKMSKWIE